MSDDLRLLDRWLGRQDHEKIYDFCFDVAMAALGQPGLATATAAVILQVMNAWEKDLRFPMPVVEAAYVAAVDLKTMMEVEGIFGGKA